ncbi:AhpC-TSA-domain-containing protein [Annulohypoxylon maeteangense]|uniref:AhpC-TSA-domain-containing protein n=1 Tax=Annulohypoxylon maeteangense TaxID=1927788 RepID=UPI002007BEB3|nr:AhpC-TSA-domain-containing protein [Annulohypoxylon maeteangense]KAI0880486.1 AhpC-TSA-domain-containing protein [Annulohypoxylon maeteangense]
MSLQTELENVDKQFSHAPAEIRDPIISTRLDFAKSFDPTNAIKVGQKIPSFTLPDSLNKTVSSTDLLAAGPLLITFYRGGWCPFCNIALHALQAKLPEIKAKGVTLVAITPELPDSSLTTAEKQGLTYPVLSDVGNKYAHQLGIVWAQPSELREVFAKIGNDLKKRNGDDSLEVPIPATLLVDREGTVRNLFLEANYSKRVEPDEVLGWINAL